MLSAVRKHSHFQTPLEVENPSVQTHLVLLCCIKRLCILGPKGAIHIRYYYYYYYYYYYKQTQISSETGRLSCHGVLYVVIDTMYQTFVDNPRMTRIRERTVWIHVDVPGQGYNVADLPAEYVVFAVNHSSHWVSGSVCQ